MRPQQGRRDGPVRHLLMMMLRCRNDTQKRVVAHLAYLESEHGQATPSRAGMAHAIGRCERSVSRAVTDLEDAGVLYVKRDRPHSRADGTWTRCRTNLYRLKWPPRGRVAPGRTEGTSMSRLSDSEAIEPRRRRPQAAPTPSGDAPAALFVLEPDVPPPDPPAPPPWIVEGISRSEWIRRYRD